MRCSVCGAENSANARFCEACGARLARVCPACGHQARPMARFCSECGEALPIPPNEGGLAPPPEAYTPPHLAERILSSAGALAGERKQVTVLFADLKDSLELLADRDPEEAQVLLGAVVERMMEAVHRYDGTVNQAMGDGIMALFGAPVALEDHAVRACYAALRMLETVGRYAEEAGPVHGVPIEIRVGLHSGEVVVGAIGSDLRMDYTAVGQTTHLAARMEQMAEPGSIRASGETIRLAEGFVHARSLGQVAVRGLATPVEVFQLLGAAPIRRSLQLAAARARTRLIGRGAELRVLRHSLALARAGQGQVVAAVGEPGVGKTRLLYEFIHSAPVRDWLVLESGSVSYEKASPYRPLIDLLRAYFQVESGEEAGAVRRKVADKLRALGRPLEPALPALLALFDLPVEPSASSRVSAGERASAGQAEWQALEPPQRRQRTLDAVRDLLLRESLARPLLLIFENLHWIDGETEALLDGLVESLPNARILLLISYRPEYRHAWGDKAYFTRLSIDPLPPQGADELLRELLENGGELEPLKRLLIERTEGNPFFLEESVRALVETGALVGGRGAYRLAGHPRDIRVPRTVQAVLAARIDRLPPVEKHLLESAAVIGKDVPFTLLAAIAELPEEAIRERLSHLQAAELLYETRLFPEPEYTFKHALTHEVGYGSLLQERRRMLHARIVDAIETHYAERLSEQVERLAHHALRAERWDKALPYLRQAGVRVAERAANREAVEYFEQAMAALEHLPAGPQRLEQAIDLRFELRTSLLPLGEIDRILALLGEAEVFATELGDERRLGRVSSFMTAHYWQIGENARAVEAGTRALDIADRLDDFALRVATNQHLAQVYFALGEYRRAIDLLRANLTALQGDLVREHFGVLGYPAIGGRNVLIWSLAELGAFDEALLVGEEAIRIAELVEDRFSLVYASYRLGGVHLRKGELERALTLLERSHRQCREWGFRALFPWTASLLGHAHALAGRPDEGAMLLEQAVEQAAAIRFTTLQALWHTWLGEAYLAAGRLDDAAGLCRGALEVARQRGERGNEAYVTRLEGDLAAHGEPADLATAENRFRRALALAETLGMRPLSAQCHFDLGLLARRRGLDEAARTELSEALRQFRAMEMPLWIARAEAELEEGTSSSDPRGGPSTSGV